MSNIQCKDSNKSYNLRVKKYLPGGIHYNFNLPWEETPLHFSSTKGSRVIDLNGKEYLDLYARFGAMIVGHGNEYYSNMLKACIDRVLSVSHCDLDAEILEMISQFVPCAEMIRFGLSGTEIVQAALRVARAYTGRNKFIRFENHYHGNADNIMGGRPKSKEHPYPEDYLGDIKGTLGRADNIMYDQSYLLPWNDIEILTKFVEENHKEIAAIITEPVCVNGGSIMPVDGYLQKMRILCDKYGIVLIFDEIITGFRMGLGGAQAEFDVIPDLATLGKALSGGGVPVSALVGKKELMQLIVEKRVIHGGTFNGYPLGTYAIKATLDLLSANSGNLYKKMEENIIKIQNSLLARAKAVGLPLIIQGPPSCSAYHCTDKKLSSPAEYNFEIMSMDIILNNNLAKEGILVSTMSRLYPNITLNDQDVKWFDERVNSALIKTKKIYDEINE